MNLSSESTQLLETRLNELPDELKMPLLDGTVATAIETAAQSHHLAPSAEAAISNEVTLVLLCFKPYEDLKDNLLSAVELPDQVVTAIYTDLDNTLFVPVKDLLIAITEIQDEADLAEDEREDEAVDFMSALNQAYRNSDPTLQKLFTSAETEETLARLWQTHGGSEEQYGAFANTVGDVILGTYEVGGLPKLLQEKAHVNEDTAFKLTSELVEFLTPRLRIQTAGVAPEKKEPEIVVEATPAALTTEARNKQAAEMHLVIGKTPTKNQPSKPPEPVGVITPAPATPTAEAKPSAAPAPAAPLIEPVHTMQSDIDLLRARHEGAPVGYGSANDAAHGSDTSTQKPHLARAPKYDDTDPRSGNLR